LVAAISIVFATMVPAAAQEALTEADTADIPEVSDDVYDPLEDVNRFFFQVNEVGDEYVLEPVARGYVWLLPDFAQNGVTNVLDNLDSPIIFANDVFQAEFERAGTTLARFLINSTIGLAGFVDVAEDWGLERHDEDFGQTLAVWGVSSGPYLYLPGLGPSPPRDLVGRVGDTLIDPFTWMDGDEIVTFGYVRTAMNILDLRARNLETLDEIERTSIDFYAAVRSLYRQSRQGAINNGRTDFEDLPSFEEEFDMEDF
jgi:phospholipid-binding lipoprotein MlaA